MKNFTTTCIIAFCMFMFFTPSHAMEQLILFERSMVGEHASDFTLPTANGKKINMTEYREENSAIIFFWATWCPHCRVALKDLNENRQAIEQKGIKLIIVDIEESEAIIKDYKKKNNIDMDIFLDLESSVGRSYNVMGIPTFIFVNKKGIINDVGHALPDDYEEVLNRQKSEN